MGCHIWLYKHEPEKNDYYKKTILDCNLNWYKYMLDTYLNPDNEHLKILNSYYTDFVENCKNNLEYINNYSECENIKSYGSIDEVNKEKKFCTEAINWNFDDYVQHTINEIKDKIAFFEKGEIESVGDFEDPEDEVNHLYCIINDKIYVGGIIPHGDDIGRIHDYEQPRFFTAEETIKCFKEHSTECNEELIKELFANNDMFVEFG